MRLDSIYLNNSANNKSNTMKQPVKIIFDDGSEEMWLDAEVFDYIDDEDIIEYAEWSLDMKQEDDIEEQSIDDFSDDEILDELLHRYKIHKDIISMRRIQDFLNNFYTL